MLTMRVKLMSRRENVSGKRFVNSEKNRNSGLKFCECSINPFNYRAHFSRVSWLVMGIPLHLLQICKQLSHCSVFEIFRILFEVIQLKVLIDLE